MMNSFMGVISSPSVFNEVKTRFSFEGLLMSKDNHGLPRSQIFVVKVSVRVQAAA